MEKLALRFVLEFNAELEVEVLSFYLGRFDESLRDGISILWDCRTEYNAIIHL